MADVNFFGAGAPDPNADPIGFMNQQRMAQALQQRGATPAQGQMVNGQYVAPSSASYVTQMANALAGGYKAGQLRDASRASTILNGGTPSVTPIQQVGSWLGSLGGGA